MQLPRELQLRLAREFRFAATMMAQESDPHRKLFFLSAFYGEANRSLNWAWDRDLALIHTVLQHTYQLVVARIQSGDRATKGLSQAVFNGLSAAANDLASYVESGGQENNLQTILGRFAELSYAATGNGGYLIENGTLKL